MDSDGLSNLMLSVVIVTLNEENKIRDCLESVKWADEIIVVDSKSQDHTVDIARKYTSKVYQQEYLGGGPMRNLGIARADGDWILTIDADERVTDELHAEIQEILKSPQSDGYYIARKVYFLGKWIKHCGWWPDYALRLFRKSKGGYDEHLAHAKVLIKGKTARLKSPLLHFTVTSLSECFTKINARTDLMVQENGASTSLFKTLSHAWVAFFSTYFIKRGFLDGKEGLILAILSFYYTFMKYIKLWEKGHMKGMQMKANWYHPNPQ